MKLLKQFSGEYKGQAVVKGLKVELTASSLDGKGFSFRYTINNNEVYSDGWYGLRLTDIKRHMNKDIEIIVNEYKKNNNN